MQRTVAHGGKQVETGGTQREEEAKQKKENEQGSAGKCRRIDRCTSRYSLTRACMHIVRQRERVRRIERKETEESQRTRFSVAPVLGSHDELFALLHDSVGYMTRTLAA